MDIEPYLEAHAFLRVERPPELWEVECSEQAFLGVLGQRRPDLRQRQEPPTELRGIRHGRPDLQEPKEDPGQPRAHRRQLGERTTVGGGHGRGRQG